MAKKKIYHNNRKQDAACKYLHNRIKLVLPYIYSAIALALWNVLDESEEEKERDIATLINESQIIWDRCVEENKNIVDWCEEVTGFDIRNSVS